MLDLKENSEGRTRGMGLTRPPEKRKNMKFRRDNNEYEKVDRTK